MLGQIVIYNDKGRRIPGIVSHEFQRKQAFTNAKGHIEHGLVQCWKLTLFRTRGPQVVEAALGVPDANGLGESGTFVPSAPTAAGKK